MESASVNAELPDAFPPALPLAGEGAPALLVAVLAAMGATLAVVSTSIWQAPPMTPPEPVTIVVHEKSPPPPPTIIEVPVPTPAPPPTIIEVPAPAAPPPCFNPVTLLFAPDSTVPPAGTSAGIARLRDWLDQHGDARLLVEGHADSRGREGHNLTLSFARAKSVASTLARNGIPAGRITVRAAGAAEAAANREWVTSVGHKRISGIDSRDRRVVVGIEGLAACKSATGATEHP
jgi:outer membrane protein OmpA-like peptidoglycan-associated protein